MKLFFILILLGLVGFGLFSCSSKNVIKKNKKTIERVKANKNLIQSHIIELKDYQIYYTSVGDPKKPTVIFIHGTPGGWGTYATYFEQVDLLEKYHLVSVDRPGWGNSSFPSKDFPKTLSEQAKLLAPLFKELATKDKPVILVGHSYGGSLVPKLAADYPELIRGILILAGDVGPDLAKARWFNQAFRIFPKWMVPDFWYYSNQEVLSISPELEKLEDQYRSLRLPIIILQGTKDGLVRPENANYAKTLFAQAPLTVIWLKGAGHVINLTHVDDVKKAIDLLDEQSKKHLNQ